MNPTIRAELLEMLDRRCRALDAPDASFPVECVSLVKWLVTEHRLRPYMLSIRDRTPREVQTAQRVADELLAPLLAARRELSARKLSDDADEHDPTTFGYFDRLAKQLDTVTTTGVEPTLRLARALDGAVRRTRHELSLIGGAHRGPNWAELTEAEGKACERAEEIFARLEFAHKDAANARATSPASALEGVLTYCRFQNDQPVGFSSWLDFVPDVVSQIQAPGKRLEYAENKVTRDRAARKALARLVDGLRDEMTSAAVDMVLIDRFAHRSQLFDRERLAGNDNENALTLELARYLHDQGLNVWVRQRFGNSELDATVNGFVVEAKVLPVGCTQAVVRERVRQGYRQLHGYMTKLSGDGYDAPSGAVVLFRHDGSLPELPSPIVRDRFTMYGRVIDVGHSSVSGSRQPDAIEITEAEILQALSEPEAEPP
jgi:hypothetical protein